MTRMLTLLVAAGIIGIGLTAWTFIRSKSTYAPTPAMESFYDLSINTLEGEPFDLASLKGKRILVVNTASKCGFTPQYEGLEALYSAHKDNNFVILGFPCNDFGNQEPGTEEEIGSFCQRNYGVSFPMMEKVSVKGDNQHPVYGWLCNESKNGVGDHSVKWNFHKFLIDEEGRLVASLRSAVKPDDPTIVAFAQGE